MFFMCLFSLLVRPLCVQDDAESKIGFYAPPPKNAAKLTASLRRVKVSKISLPSPEDISFEATLCLEVLAERTQRFEIQTHKQREQAIIEGAKIPTVDYILIANIAQLQVTGIKSGAWNSKSEVTVACEIEIRVVELSSGTVLSAKIGKWNPTGTAEELGIEITGELRRQGKDTELDIAPLSRGQIVRRTMDDAVRKLLPKVDQKLGDGK